MRGCPHKANVVLTMQSCPYKIVITTEVKSSLQSLQCQLDLLHHRLRLARWVVWTEVLELFHLLLHRKQLRLELVAEVGKRVADVVRQLLVEGSL